MKNTGKLASLLLAMVMLLAMSAPALAEESYSITIENGAEGHIYEAYQIFRGVLSDGVLSDVEWGDSVANAGALADGASVAERLDASYAGSDGLSLGDLLAMIELGSPVADSGTTADPYVISGLAAGYYLVKDQEGTLEGRDDAYTEYIIRVVEDVTAKPKSGATEVEKKVRDVNDSDGKGATDWQDAADHDVGDSVSFRLKATLAGNVSAYEGYEVAFHDALSAGLTYNGDAKAYIDGKQTDGFTVSAAAADGGGTALTVSCEDVKALGAVNNSVITVEYTATLNERAVVGAEGNPNDVWLEYSNNPYLSTETGRTPKDTVIVFTYKTVVSKVAKNPAYDSGDEASEPYIPLAGAAFSLEKYDGTTEEWAEIAAAVDESGTVFTFTGLDDGLYRLTETEAPKGYNSIAPIEFTVTAQHDILSDDPALTALSGSAANGELSFTADLSAGALSADVLNKAGATLPETGGVGTTMFYAAGGVLVALALAAMLARRRMNRAK